MECLTPLLKFLQNLVPQQSHGRCSEKDVASEEKRQLEMKVLEELEDIASGELLDLVKSTIVCDGGDGDGDVDDGDVVVMVIIVTDIVIRRLYGGWKSSK